MRSESTVALAWLPESPQCLAIGTGVKWLRIYDLRGKLKKKKPKKTNHQSVIGLPTFYLFLCWWR